MDRTAPIPTPSPRHLLIRVALGMGTVAHVTVAVHEEPLFPDEGQQPEIRLPEVHEWPALIRAMARMDFDSIQELSLPEN